MNADVQRQQGIHVIELATGGQRLAAATPLFSGLEEQFDTAVQPIGEGGDPLGQHQPDGGMAIMGAGVHPAGVARVPTFLAGGMQLILALLDLHRIDVEAKGQGRARSAAVPQSHHPRYLFDPAQPVRMGALAQGSLLLGLHVYVASHDEVAGQQLVTQHDGETEFIEVVSDEGAGTKFTPGRFGQTMKITTPMA